MAGRGPAGHDRGQGHRRQSAVRDAADGDRLDSARRRAIDTTRPAGLAPVTVDPGFRNASLRSWNVNLQRQLARGPGRDGRLFRLARQRPAHLAQHQPAGRRRSAVPGGVGVEPDSARRAARQHHAGGEHAGSRATTRCGCRPPSGCRAGCSSTRRTPGRSRSTPIRSIRRASPSRTATTSPTSTACRTSTRATDSCSARPTSCRSRGTR